MILVLLWNVEFWVVRLVGKTSEDDSFLTNQIEGMSKTWRGGILEGGQTPPLPSRRKELVQLGGGSMVTVGGGSMVTVYMYRRHYSMN